MDSTNGVSEENHRKNDDGSITIRQDSEFRKISIEDLPFDEQEKIREFMEMTGDDKEPELFMANFVMEIEDLAAVPLDILGSMYRDAVFNEKYEDVGELGEEIKNRNYSIEITEKSVTLRWNETDKN